MITSTLSVVYKLRVLQLLCHYWKLSYYLLSIIIVKTGFISRACIFYIEDLFQKNSNISDTCIHMVLHDSSFYW